VNRYNFGCSCVGLAFYLNSNQNQDTVEHIMASLNSTTMPQQGCTTEEITLITHLCDDASPFARHVQLSIHDTIADFFAKCATAWPYVVRSWRLNIWTRERCRDQCLGMEAVTVFFRLVSSTYLSSGTRAVREPSDENLGLKTEPPHFLVFLGGT